MQGKQKEGKKLFREQASAGIWESVHTLSIPQCGNQLSPRAGPLMPAEKSAPPPTTPADVLSLRGPTFLSTERVARGWSGCLYLNLYAELQPQS